MKVDASPESRAEYDAARLGMYAAEWWIWRSTDSAGRPAGWCATRRDTAAGQPMTIVRDTAHQLADKLAEETRAQRLREQFAGEPGGR